MVSGQQAHPLPGYERVKTSQEGRTCRMPLMAQKVRNQGRELPAPKAILTSAVAMRPPASMTRGDVRAPSTPLTNLENP